MEHSASNVGKVGTTDQTQGQSKRQRRPRSATMLKMQWLAERVRKCERIKAEVREGRYQVDSRAVAKALLSCPITRSDTN